MFITLISKKNKNKLNFVPKLFCSLGIFSYLCHQLKELTTIKLKLKTMENKDFIIEEEVLVRIGQYVDAPYRMVCYNGYAIGELLDKENYMCADTIRMEYPTLEGVLKDNELCHRILKYRGLWDKSADDIHYGDIMMYLGEIVDND
jgi:hypothetical protein